MSHNEQKMKFDLDNIIFIGRTFEEYLKMFDLSVGELKGKKILDCPAGACSFAAIGNGIGLNVTACDIAYDYSSEELKQKGLQDIKQAVEKMESVKHQFQWDYFKSADDLRSNRVHALMNFLNDYKKEKDRYIPVTLPHLPFRDGEFDLLLSAHFLFTYSDRLDKDFHFETISEYIRVSKEEIRIFPLVDMEGKRPNYMEQLKHYLIEHGCKVTEVKVPYEFQKNANTMLKIKKD